MIQLEGKKISLRDAQKTDLDTMQYWLHPSHEWHRFDGPYYPPASEEQIVKIVAKWEAKIANNDFPELRDRVMIACRDDNGIMGMVTRYWISEETNWTAIGISIWNPENWGKGYGYEAFGLWCDYLFSNEPKFVRLDARTWSGNLGMMKLAQKLGFQEEARFRMARIVDGQYYDGLAYGILREEWHTKYPQGFVASLR